MFRVKCVLIIKGRESIWKFNSHSALCDAIPFVLSLRFPFKEIIERLLTLLVNMPGVRGVNVVCDL